jgi:hypothetical protein
MIILVLFTITKYLFYKLLKNFIVINYNEEN